MLYPERRQITADQIHHGINGENPKGRQPFIFRHLLPFVAIAIGEVLTCLLKVITGIQAVGDFANIFTKRFPISEMSRTGENIYLGASIIDVIFPSNLEPRLGKQACQRIADNSASGMSDMHRAGRVGRDIFDIDGFIAAKIAIAIGRSLFENCRNLVGPEVRHQPHIDKSGPGHFGTGDFIPTYQPVGQKLTQLAWIRLCRLRQNHRCIGSKIAMCRIFGGFNPNTAEYEPHRKFFFINQIFNY